MRYFYHPLSASCRKTSAILMRTGLEAQWIVVDLPSGEHLTPEFARLNPNSKIPVLVDGDRSWWESNVIAIHVARTAGSSLWPADEDARLHVLKWMFWQQAHLMQATGQIVFERIVKPMLGQGSADEAVVEGALARFRRLAAVLERELNDRDYLVGTELTLADWAVAADLSYADRIELPMADSPRVTAWLARLDADPEWASTAPTLPG